MTLFGPPFSRRSAASDTLPSPKFCTSDGNHRNYARAQEWTISNWGVYYWWYSEKNIFGMIYIKWPPHAWWSGWLGFIWFTAWKHCLAGELPTSRDHGIIDKFVLLTGLWWFEVGHIFIYKSWMGVDWSRLVGSTSLLISWHYIFIAVSLKRSISGSLHKSKQAIDH